MSNQTDRKLCLTPSHCMQGGAGEQPQPIDRRAQHVDCNAQVNEDGALLTQLPNEVQRDPFWMDLLTSDGAGVPVVPPGQDATGWEAVQSIIDGWEEAQPMFQADAVGGSPWGTAAEFSSPFTTTPSQAGLQSPSPLPAMRWGASGGAENLVCILLPNRYHCVKK